MNIQEVYALARCPSTRMEQIGQMGMRTIRCLPGADFLTLEVFKNYLETTRDRNGTDKYNRALQFRPQFRAREINHAAAGAAMVFLMIGSTAHFMGYDNTDCALFCMAVWIEICLLAKKLHE